MCLAVSMPISFFVLWLNTPLVTLVLPLSRRWVESMSSSQRGLAISRPWTPPQHRWIRNAGYQEISFTPPQTCNFLLNTLSPPANPPFPISDDLEPPGEQVRDDRPAGLHRLLLHHPQGEAQRDHAAQHRAEPWRLLQLESMKDPKNEKMCSSCTSTYWEWSKACTKPVLPASEPWPTALVCIFIFVQLCRYICAIQLSLCVHMCVFIFAYFALSCVRTVPAVPDPSAKTPQNLPVRVVKILT